jgi:transcriptional regulator with XRE-family HTH domain
MGVDGKAVASAFLRDLRQRQGLSQRALAQRAGVPQPTVAEIEAGRREPTLSLLSNIAEAVDEVIEVRAVPLKRFSAVATSRQIKDRLFGSKYQELTPSLRKDGALRSVLDMRDALRRSSEDELRQLIDVPPTLVGDSRWDAFVAAVVEDESARKSVISPRWTNDPRRFVKPFWYLSDIPELHAWELANAPASFVRHGVLAAEEELESV